MRGPIRSILLAVVAVCAFAALTVASASGAVLRETTTKTAFQAIYGSPSFSTTQPIGGGLGRNFGFGENMLFCASTVQCKPSENLDIEIEKTSTEKAETAQTYIGGTLMSNKTGASNPLSFDIQFSDFQNNKVGTEAIPSYSDTNDRPWISEICAPGAETCRVDPLFTVGATKVNVKIEDVSIDLGGTVVQGTVWGTWENGKPPCIKLALPPEKAGANQNLIVTQSSVFPVGSKVTAVSGKACLISANNNYYTGKEPEIEISNAE